MEIGTAAAATSQSRDLTPPPRTENIFGPQGYPCIADVRAGYPDPYFALGHFCDVEGGCASWPLYQGIRQFDPDQGHHPQPWAHTNGSGIKKHLKITTGTSMR